jgi:hypothetical protein
VLQVAAVVAAVSIVAGTVVGWRLLGRIEDVADRGAEVSLAALDAVEASLATADEVLVDARSTLEVVADALDAATTSFGDASDVLSAVGVLSETAAPSLESASDSLGTLEGVGRTVDTTLEALASLPFGPDYDPDQGFGATIGRLRADLEPLPDALRSTADELGELVASGDGLEGDLAAVARSLDDVVVGLDDSDDLVAGYRDAAREARRLARDAGGGLGIDLLLGRILLLLGGVALAIVQVVPWRFGRTLTDRG